MTARRQGAARPLGLREDELRAMAATCVCYHLRRAARAVTQRFDGLFARHGLRATQFTLLCYLAGRGPSSAVELARAMATDTSTLSRNLAVLARRGLVRPHRRADRRVRAFALTAAGRAVIARAYPDWQRAQGSLGLRPKELGTTLRALRSLVRRASDERTG